MGLLSKLFGTKHMHVYLHVDGEIAVTGANIPKSLESISKREIELTEQLDKMDPDLSDIQIPEVDFGSDVEDNPENIDE
jgi:hypothetical protein